jgi:hypothetical protein
MMTSILGLYLWLAPMLFFVAGGVGGDSHPFVVGTAWVVHVLAFLLYTLLVDDHGFRRGWEICENTLRQPPGPI